MIQRTYAPTLFLAALAVALACGANQRAALAQQTRSPHTLNDPRGGVRSGTAQSMQITVMLAGKPWGKASVTITKADGTVAFKGFTQADGTFTSNAQLDAGSYTVTASTMHWTGTGSVTLKQSTDKASLKVVLKKKPSAN